MFSIDWHQKFMDVVVYAGWFFLYHHLMIVIRLILASNPWQFIYYVLLCLTPMFIISGYLAYRLAKDIERNEKSKRAKAHQKANIVKVRKHAKRE
jgi:hypothetical protein